MTNAFGLSPVVVATWMAAAVGVVLLVLLILAAFNRMLLRMALRNTVRRRGQSVLIVVGLMLATVIFTASLGVGDTLTYSVQADQLRHIGGIDEGFTRHGPNGFFDNGPIALSGASDFFTDAEATDVIARSLSDPNVAAAAALVAVPGSVVDKTTSQTGSMNVTVFGVGDDFDRVWGTLRSRSGATIHVSELGPDEVYIGLALANRLAASAGDKLNVYVDGHLTDVRVRQVLDTDVNRPPPFWIAPITYAFPSAAASSLLMPLAAVQGAIHRPKGYNLILLHNRGSGGFDDLGPGGAAGREIARRMHIAFTDRQAAAEMKAYLSTPAMRAQLRKVPDQAVIIDPARDAARALLVALDRPQVDDDFIALVTAEYGQSAIRQAALINLANPSPEWRAAEQDLEDRFTSLRVDSRAAGEMKALLDSAEIRNPLTQIAAELPPSDPVATTINSLVLEARRADVTPRFKAIVGDPNLQLELGMTIGKVAPAQQARFTEIASRLDLYVFFTYKADALVNGQFFGLLASTILLSVSLFAIAVGGLLIFLIFVMLAAERRAEMGMSRALGLRRRDLIQCFMFEGTAYTLVASGMGVMLGVLVGRLMTFVMPLLFGTLAIPIALQYQVDWTSLAIATCLGILLTFAIVAFSAYKVSRLNIVAAIRDLDENEARDASLSRMFTSVFRTAWFGVRQLLKGHPLVFLNRISLSTLEGIRTFWWALFRRGPLTILLGTLLVAFAVGQEPVVVAKDGIGGQTNYWSPFIYGVGVSLVIVGAGLMIKWLFTLGGMRRLSAARVGFTVAALGLLIYWGQPLGQVEKLLHIQDALQVSKLRGGIEIFVFSALMLLLGAIWLVIYNVDVLIRVVTSVTGRIGSLAPVTRTSMAYPMASKFRTGMAIALFALVTFTIVFMSIFKETLTQNAPITDASMGGWHIVAGSTYLSFTQSSTIELPTDIAALVRADSRLHSEVRAAGWENSSVEVQTAQADGTTSYNALRVVDDVYLSNTGFAVKQRAAGYSSDRAAWEAVRDNVGFAIVSSPGDRAAFEPYQLQLFRTDGRGNATKESMTVTVVGYAAIGLWDGLYVSTRTALAGGFFAPSTAESTPPRLASSQPPLTPTGLYFKLQPGVDAQKARRDVGRFLVNYRLEPIGVAELVNQPVRASAAVMSLLTGFLALGLVVGIAGLGVISSRAVLERWQQIGMLRALGYRGSLVQRSFLMESSLIAILGLTIGTTVGVWYSYSFLITDRVAEFYAFGGKALFHVPIVEIAGILVLAYLATLVTTYLPARAASRIAPAEALRYE